MLVDTLSDTEKFAVPETGKYKFADVPLNDPRVYSIFHKGETIGVFQLEKKLGQDWARKVKPDNIEELAALISILRPGCLESGISEQYIRRKFGLEEITYQHPSLEPILRDTYGVIIFQESILRIGIEVAGLTEEESDTYLRKMIGKKKPELVAKARAKFVTSAIKKGVVDEKMANELFDIIEKFQRYGFNKCLSPNTLVTTNNGPKKLHNLCIGDKILSVHDNEMSKLEFTTVTDIINCGEQELYEVTLTDGKKIECTMEHEFWCSDNNKYTLFDIIHNKLEIIVD